MVELLTTTSCDCAPPSDHDLNCQAFFAFVCGEIAEIEWRDPWITVLLNGVAACAPSSVRARPPGLELSVRVTVLGSSGIDFVSVRPPESLAVSRSSKWDGYP